jgi:hypothetical protein
MKSAGGPTDYLSQPRTKYSRKPQVLLRQAVVANCSLFVRPCVRALFAGPFAPCSPPVRPPFSLCHFPVSPFPPLSCFSCLSWFPKKMGPRKTRNDTKSCTAATSWKPVVRPTDCRMPSVAAARIRRPRALQATKENHRLGRALRTVRPTDNLDPGRHVFGPPGATFFDRRLQHLR